MPRELLRVPYTACQMTDWEGGLMVLIYPISDEMVPARGLSERFASFIQDHCRCRWCRRPMRDLALHLHCSKAEPFALWPVSPAPLNEWAQALYKAELAHRRQVERLHGAEPSPRERRQLA